jgi:acyl carrier protein
VDKIQITQMVFSAVDEVNQILRKAQRLEKSTDTIISGPDSRLDSLGLVNLIFAVEQKIEQQSGMTITLADESTLNGEQDPFRTLGTLAEHIQTLLEKVPPR